MNGLANVYWSSYEYEYEGACGMIVSVSVRTNLDSGISMCINVGMCMVLKSHLHLKRNTPAKKEHDPLNA